MVDQAKAKEWLQKTMAWLNKEKWWAITWPLLLVATYVCVVVYYKKNDIWLCLCWLVPEVAIPPAAYLWLKLNLPDMAHRNHLFTTVKKGRIKLVKLAGKVVMYVGNLFDVVYFDKEGVEHTGMQVDQNDGKVSGIPEAGHTWLEENFWWRYFGVIWIGFGGTVYEYSFTKLSIIDGEVTKPKPEEAQSIFIRQPLVVLVENCRTKDMIPVKMVAQAIIETNHAGLSLNFYNWNSLIEAQIGAACREFIATHDLDTVNVEKSEEGGKLWRYVAELNHGDIESIKKPPEEPLLPLTPAPPNTENETKKKRVGKGNVGLPKQFGQTIIGFSVLKIEILDDEVMKAVRSQKVAAEKLKGIELDAKAKARAIEIEAAAAAAALEIKGQKANRVTEELAVILDKEGAKEVEVARAWATHNGTLALGAGTGIMIRDSEPKPQKGEEK